jgi:hypothetical protein
LFQSLNLHLSVYNLETKTALHRTHRDGYTTETLFLLPNSINLLN